jgi:hypothetical protein
MVELQQFRSGGRFCLTGLEKSFETAGEAIIEIELWTVIHLFFLFLDGGKFFEEPSRLATLNNSHRNRKTNKAPYKM